MRKLIVSEFLSVDGSMSAPGDGMGWVQGRWDDAAEGAYQHEVFDRVDTMLLGRTTYDILGGYWPLVPSDPAAPPGDRALAPKVNATLKVVVSSRDVKPHWSDTRHLRTLTHDAVMALKDGPGSDILVVGSADLVHQLTDLGLVDEYHLLVYPVLLAGGKPLFAGCTRDADLELVRSQAHDNGVVLLCYRKVSAAA